MADVDVDERPDLLAAAIGAHLPPSAEWSFPGGYPNSLALAVIDAIQSMGVRYGSVVKVIGRYRSYRHEQGGDANTDGITELKASFDDLGVQEWSTVIGNGNRVSTAPGAITKAEAIRRAEWCPAEWCIGSTVSVSS